MVDFLIVYELEQRELENVTLLGAELERRGYSVAFEKFMYLSYSKMRKKYKNKAKVIVIHSMYNETVIYNLVYAAVGSASKIVNLQWEQVGTIRDENSTTAFRYPKESAKSVPHICWGPKMQEILVRCGMEKERAPVTGPIHMDFLRKEFEGYYKSKDELFDEFDLPKDKKILLFLSSFSYTSLTEEQVAVLLRSLNKERFEAFRKISVDSQKAILEWIEKYLNENPDDIFVYRPHPAEAGNKLLGEYEKRNPRLYVIGKYSVKQWIKTSDVIFNWFSTSMAEVYFDGKDCYVLRPVEMEQERDVAIMRDCKFITRYEDFLAAANGSTEYIASAEALKSYYDVTDVPSYYRCADFLEDVCNTDKYDYNWSSKLKRSFWLRYKKDCVKRIGIGAVHFLRFAVHNLKKVLKLSYNEHYANFYAEMKAKEASNKKAQKEKLELMRIFVKKYNKE
ncbi:MAG: hypothetical protein II998_08345 [Clostridia bacterium]|nr:hypothetical protein [Clostridia bacterium]